MQNPLAQFLPVEDRIDGVYIKVPRERKGKIACDKIIGVLDKAQVTNYNRSRIEEVINRARGAPEKIGPPFEFYNSAVEEYVTVSITDTEANIKINPAFATAGIKLTPTLLAYCLKRKGIVFGLLEENLQKLIDEELYDKDVLIAKSIAPVDGKDARIQYEVDMNKTLRPQTRRDGSADFRKVHTFTQVKEGQVLARKIPATNGTPGRRVTGEIIPCNPGNDIDLPQGTNTASAEDGCALVAAKTGLLKTEGTLLAVAEQLEIQKDVDFSVGNIKYAGNLLIKGSVKPGFVVDVEGDIEIQGIVESATVKSRNGSVSVKKGVLGKGDAFIYAKHSIETLFAQEASLETEGTIVIERHCMHCETTCTSFEASQPQSNIVGGTTKAAENIVATQIGNPKNIDTRIILFDQKKGEAKKKLEEYCFVKDKITSELEPVKKQVAAKAAIFKKAGDLVSAKQKAEMKKWIDSYNVLNMKLNYAQQKIRQVTEKLHGPASYNGYVKVIGSLFPGTILELYGRKKVIQNRLDKKTFRIDKNGEIAGV